MFMSPKNQVSNNQEVVESYSKEHLDFLQAVKRQRILVWSTRLIILILFFALWELAANLRWIDPFITSQPSRMWETFINLQKDGLIYKHMGITISETVVG